jgi:hypothetical protein
MALSLWIHYSRKLIRAIDRTTQSSFTSRKKLMSSDRWALTSPIVCTVYAVIATMSLKLQDPDRWLSPTPQDVLSPSANCSRYLQEAEQAAYT